MEKMNAYDTGKVFMDSINNCLWEPIDFAKVVCSGHRYLQQQAFNTFMRCIEMWAMTGNYDERNERAVKLSKKIWKELFK